MACTRNGGPRIDGGVVWRRVTTPDPVRILPDGCIDLIWTSDGNLLVAGPDTRPQILASPPGRRYVGIRFASGQGPAVLGVPARELLNRRVLLDEIWRPGEVRRLSDRLATSGDAGAVLEAVSAARLQGSEDMTRLPAEVVRLLRAGRSVAQVADAVGLSERHLLRRSLDAFGYGPKTMARILRLNQAMDLARSGISYVDVALAAGYADQAHLARDVRTLSGTTLTQLNG